MVHQFYCFISLEFTKTSLILVQIEENWVLWLKLVANRIYLSAPFSRLWSLKTIVVCYLSAMEGGHLYHFKRLWYGVTGCRTSDLPHPKWMFYHLSYHNRSLFSALNCKAPSNMLLICHLYLICRNCIWSHHNNIGFCLGIGILKGIT